MSATTTTPGVPAAFEPPPYPFDRLSELVALASAHPGGMVDLSIGTPCDPPPPFVVETLATSDTERGYPPSAGSPALRQAASDWMARRFGVDVPADAVAACVGTKELVATLPWLLRLRRPERDTVLYPSPSYPTYEMGARLAGCRAVVVPAGADGAPDFEAIGGADAARALGLWVNSPANPSGALSDLAAAAAWGRAHGVPVLSDECYAEFTWAVWPPPTILQAGTDGLLAVHSLSKRSNLAGLRVGFYAGDADLVRYLSEVRKHAGLMVPGPAQAAAAVALADDHHVEHQRRTYRRRMERLAGALGRAGLDVPLPDGGFYLWVPVPPSFGAAGGDWVLARALAATAGVLASPGELFGDEGHVRLAVVQPDDRLALVEERLAAVGTLRLDPVAS